MGVRYVKDEEEGWSPVVRRMRKKSAGCVGDGELRVDGGNVVRFRSLNGIPGINIRDWSFRHWVAAKPSQYLQEPELDLNIN